MKLSGFVVVVFVIRALFYIYRKRLNVCCFREYLMDDGWCVCGKILLETFLRKKKIHARKYEIYKLILWFLFNSQKVCILYKINVCNISARMHKTLKIDFVLKFSYCNMTIIYTYEFVNLNCNYGFPTLNNVI